MKPPLIAAKGARARFSSPIVAYDAGIDVTVFPFKRNKFHWPNKGPRRHQQRLGGWLKLCEPIGHRLLATSLHESVGRSKFIDKYPEFSRRLGESACH